MASLRERVTKRGETTFQVLFREGGKQSSETFTTEKSALKFKALIDAKVPRSQALDILGGRVAEDQMTLDELAEKYFDWKTSRVTPRTIRDYRRDYTNYWQAKLGHRPAAGITHADVQAGVDRMAKTLDPKSVRDRHLVLHSIYAYGAAPTRRLVPGNPCEHTDLPKRRHKPVKGATLAEWQAIYDEAHRSEPDAADLLLFLVATGWRWSEAAALLVRNVDDTDTVMRVVVGNVFRRDAADRQVLVESSKSEAGYRAVAVGPDVAAIIRGRLIGKGPDDFVFTSSTGKPWRQSNFLGRTWKGIVDRAGLERRPSPHWLRHTHVLLLIRAGVSLPEIQRRLGHEDIQTTINVYGRMVDGIAPEALTALDTMVLGPRVGHGAVVPGAVESSRTEELER